MSKLNEQKQEGAPDYVIRVKQMEGGWSASIYKPDPNWSFFPPELIEMFGPFATQGNAKSWAQLCADRHYRGECGEESYTYSYTVPKGN